MCNGVLVGRFLARATRGHIFLCSPLPSSRALSNCGPIPLKMQIQGFCKWLVISAGIIACCSCAFVRAWSLFLDGALLVLSLIISFINSILVTLHLFYIASRCAACRLLDVRRMMANRRRKMRTSVSREMRPTAWSFCADPRISMAMPPPDQWESQGKWQSKGRRNRQANIIHHAMRLCRCG